MPFAYLHVRCSPTRAVGTRGCAYGIKKLTRTRPIASPLTNRTVQVALADATVTEESFRVLPGHTRAVSASDDLAAMPELTERGILNALKTR